MTSLELAAEMMGPNPADIERTDPLRILALIAACYDAADNEDDARVLGYRILSMADRAPRALHTWFHADRTTGDTDQHQGAPDGYDRVKAITRTVRSRKGVTYQDVVMHGRGYVQGSAERRSATFHGPTLPGRCTMSARALQHAIETAPRAVNGTDAVSLARLADVAYPDVPRLIGADVLSFAEFGTWDPDRARTPRKGPGTRYRLPTVRARSGEIREPFELLAPAADPDHVWIGHRHVRRSITVRAERAKRAKRTDLAVVVPAGLPLADGLAAAVCEVPRVPYRVTWERDDMRGTVTVTGSADRKRFSVTGLPVAVRNLRTVEGLRRAIIAAE